MEEQGIKGLIAFTSSSAGEMDDFQKPTANGKNGDCQSSLKLLFLGFFPNPLSAIYPSTKAFLTSFATSMCV